jgi:hypothetical protein
LWKLRSSAAITTLLDALEREKDPQARVGLAVNTLAAAGETKIPRSDRDRLWRLVWPILRRGELPDPAENAALRDLYQSYRRRPGSDAQATPQKALEGLRRFWAE